MRDDQDRAWTWGEGVRMLRNIRNLSQVQLAEMAGVTQPSISRIESGSRQVSDAARVRIARALGVDPHVLFPYIDDAADQVSA
jgi:transcriptional regulator with XRE-family HTH domain